MSLSLSDRKPIAFLFPAFPVLHQTFVLWEVMALRRLGVPIALYSLKQPSTRTQQPEGAALVHEVTYLPRVSPAVFRANLRVLLRSPGRYLGAFVRLARHCWADRHLRSLWHDKSARPDPAERMLRPRERVLGFIHTNPVVYLLRSWLLAFIAVYLGEELRRAGIGRIHAHWASYPTTVALVIRWIFGIPFSFSAHAYDIYLVPQLLPVKIRSAEFVVTCARFNAAYLGHMAGAPARGRIHLNYHGVDLARFRANGRPAAAGLPRIVTCGRLQLYKGHHILLRACAALAQPVRCIIIGEGPQRATLERLAHSLGIADRVEFTGPLPQEEVVRHYREATLFVLASIVVTSYAKRDVIPNVLAEAMAMQVPVVATDISGIGELVSDRSSGRLVPPGDADALARVLDELLRDEAQRRRLALGGYQTVVETFDRSTNIRELARLFTGEAAGTMLDVGQSTVPRSGETAPCSGT
jgi:colanic acid/amylovoran biosynthesis glycosyltransferase